MRKSLPFILSVAAVLVVGLDLLHVSVLVPSSNARSVLWSMAVAGASIALVLVLPSVALALVLRPFRERVAAASVVRTAPTRRVRLRARPRRRGAESRQRAMLNIGTSPRKWTLRCPVNFLDGLNGERCRECPGAQACAARQALSGACDAAYRELGALALSDILTEVRAEAPAKAPAHTRSRPDVAAADQRAL